MADRVLFVDDDEHILRFFRRTMSDKFDVYTATNGVLGLAAIEKNGPFAVVFADLKMPGMDGVTFLEMVRRDTPSTVRIMLTGYADLETSMRAVNKGEVFRFLSKPASPETLLETVQAGVEQYRLITAERVLLEKTLKGCIEMMHEALALSNPEAYCRAGHIHRYVRVIAQQADCNRIWKYEMAAMLSQLGCLTLTQETVSKLASGKPLTSQEKRMSDAVPEIGRRLISKIPRLGDVARMVAYQDKGYDGSGLPDDGVCGQEIPLGARILKIAGDFEKEVTKGNSWGEALLVLETRKGVYDPLLLRFLENALGNEDGGVPRRIKVADLRQGMVIEQDVYSKEELLLVKKGTVASSVLIARLSSYAEMAGVVEPFRISTGNSVLDDTCLEELESGEAGYET